MKYSINGYYNVRMKENLDHLRGIKIWWIIKNLANFLDQLPFYFLIKKEQQSSFIKMNLLLKVILMSQI